MEEEPKPKTRLEELQEAIVGSASSVESEFNRTANNWLSCFGSSVFVVETYLSSKKVEELLPPEKYQIAISRIEKLKERLSELQEQYPDKETVPPDEIKQELLDGLDVLKEL
jgi:hypothetical protein